MLSMVLASSLKRRREKSRVASDMLGLRGGVSGSRPGRHSGKGDSQRSPAGAPCVVGHRDAAEEDGYDAGELEPLGDEVGNVGHAEDHDALKDGILRPVEFLAAAA